MSHKIGDYYLGPAIGEGSFAQVKYAVNYGTGERVACKIISFQKLKKRTTKEMKNEVKICLHVSGHPNIVEVKSVVEEQERIYIFFELCGGGDLFDKISRGGPLKEHQAQQYFCDIISGLKWIHSKGVAHRDLKPENCLLDEDGHVKISDFGLASLVKWDKADEEILLKDICGSHHYSAPEILKKRPYYGTKADIWACGIILYCMVAGKLPFIEDDPVQLTQLINKAQLKYLPCFSRPIRDLFSQILQPDPDKRIGIDDIIKHKWFPKPNPTSRMTSKEKIKRASSIDLSESTMSRYRPVPTETNNLVQSLNINRGTLDRTITPSLDCYPELFKKDKKIGAEVVHRPPMVNAFDIIGWSGAFDISRIIDPNMGPKSIKARLKTQFVVEETDTGPLLTKLYSCFQNISNLKYEIDLNVFKLKIEDKEGNTGSVQIYTLAPDIFLVDFIQEEGDPDEWHAFYRYVYKCYSSYKKNDKLVTNL